MNPQTQTKDINRSFISGNQYKDHEILMRYGQWYLQCHAMNKQTYNAAYVNNKVCPDCGPLVKILPEPIDDSALENDLESKLKESIEQIDQIKQIPQIQSIAKTQVICNKCDSPMEEVAAGIYYCRNGHKKALVDLIEEKPKEEPKAKVQTKCPFCKKNVTIEQESQISNKRKIRYSCGHSEFQPLTINLDNGSQSRDEVWDKLYEFQREGVEFVERAGGSALIGDEMGLGKTVQALAFLRYNYDDATPCLMVCESSKVYDWQMEFNHWVSDKFNEIRDEPIIHQKGSYGLCPGFKNHIISMSLLQKPKVLQSIMDYGFKLVIIDESHSFKDEKASRTAAVQAIARKIPNRIFLSGTPVMNKVMEYFVPLNLLKPEHHPSKNYLADRCMRAPNGRILGLREHYRPRFFHQISEYVIRRTKKDAGIKLPKFRRNTKLVSIDENKAFVQKYNAIADDIEKLLYDKSERAKNSNTIIGLLAHLRHLIGIAKIEPTIQMVEEFLESMDSDDKIAIGVHHKLVMDKLAEVLKEHNPICISDEDPKIKMRKIEDFKRPENRVAILSILGAGQGLNLQFCKNAIIAEREWNPSKEEQFFGRFHRIEKNQDGSIKMEFDDAKDSVNVDILNVKDTIDEFFDGLIELKTKVVDSTMDEQTFYDEDIMMQLAEMVASTRLKWMGGVK